MKKISRFGFLKLAATAAMSGVTAGALTACGNSASSSSAAASGAAVYTPGTYTAKATGMGEVTVSMTFTENAITDVTVDTAIKQGVETRFLEVGDVSHSLPSRGSKLMM